MTDSGCLTARDCISLCLSFLSTADFARASRCCTSWHAIARLNTSWPRVSIQATAKLILANDYAGSNVRRISVNVNQARMRRGLMRVRHSPIWNKVEDVHIWTGGFYRLRQESFDKPPQRHEDAVLRAVSHLTALKALNLGLSRASHPAVLECFTRLAPRLECLLSNVPSTPVVASLALLTGLRVLVIRIDRSKRVAKQGIGQGPASRLAVALHALTQLTALHYEDEGVVSGGWDAPAVLLEDEERVSSEAEACQVVTAVRDLSVQYALRAFSFRWRHSVLAQERSVLDLSVLAGQGGAGPAQLEQIQLDLNLTATNVALLSSLPALSKLELRCSFDDALAEDIQCPSSASSRPSLLSSSSLRCLQLHHRPRQQRPLCSLMRRSALEFFIAMVPELEELHLNDVEVEAERWALLPQWIRLREVHLHASLELTGSQIRVLQGWRSWQVIHLYPTGSATSCGCRWRLTRESSNPSLLHSANVIGGIRLIQDAPSNADEHGHSSGEYQLSLTEEKLMNSSSDASPEWSRTSRADSMRTWNQD